MVEVRVVGSVTLEVLEFVAAKTVLVPIELGTRAFSDSDVSRVCNMYDL